MRRCKPFNRGRTSDHKRLAGWYRDNLGLVVEDWGGAILKWPEDQAEDRGLTVWHVAERESKWFSPSTSSFMINYRVDDLTALLAQLKSNGVEIVKGPDTDDNGIFAWVMDPDGNKVELWEPKDMKAQGLPIECVEHDETALRPVLIEVAEGDGVPGACPVQPGAGETGRRADRGRIELDEQVPRPRAGPSPPGTLPQSIAQHDGPRAPRRPSSARGRHRLAAHDRLMAARPPRPRRDARTGCRPARRTPR